MFSYILLLTLPIIPKLLVKTNRKQRNSISYFLFFGFLIILLTCKADFIGNDTRGYIYKFNEFLHMDMPEILSHNEPLYGLMNKLISLFSSNYRWLFFFCAVISVVPIFSLYQEYAERPYLTIAIFITISNFVMLFSGLRQSIAIAIGIIAFRFVKKKKFLWYLLMVVVAILFHNSAFMLLFMWPLYHVRLKKKHILFIIPLIILVGIFNKPIFLFLSGYVQDLYVGVIKDTGAGMMLLLFISFGAFCFLIPEGKNLSVDELAMRNFLLFSIVIQIFASINSLAMRLGYYYMVFIPPLISCTVSKSNTRFKSVAQFAQIVMILFFLGYFFIHMKSDNPLHTYPFVFFWETVR